MLDPVNFASILQTARDIAGDVGMVAGGLGALAAVFGTVCTKLGFTKPAAVCSRITDGCVAITLDVKKLLAAISGSSTQPAATLKLVK
jgi:hypothetical protein